MLIREQLLFKKSLPPGVKIQRLQVVKVAVHSDLQQTGPRVEAGPFPHSK